MAANVCSHDYHHVNVVILICRHGKCFPTNSMVLQRKYADSKSAWNIIVGRYRSKSKDKHGVMLSLKQV